MLRLLRVGGSLTQSAPRRGSGSWWERAEGGTSVWVSWTSSEPSPQTHCRQRLSSGEGRVLGKRTRPVLSSGLTVEEVGAACDAGGALASATVIGASAIWLIGATAGGLEGVGVTALSLSGVLGSCSVPSLSACFRCPQCPITEQGPRRGHSCQLKTPGECDPGTRQAEAWVDRPGRERRPCPWRVHSPSLCRVASGKGRGGRSARRWAGQDMKGRRKEDTILLLLSSVGPGHDILDIGPSWAKNGLDTLSRPSFHDL